jgi:diacylglycerol O-acyltransferase
MQPHARCAVRFGSRVLACEPVGDPQYQRLSAQDSSFVKFEGEGTHVHVTAIALFDAMPSAAAGGATQGLDIERVRAHVESRLHLIPGYRRRLAFTPIQGHPIWVDDHAFDVSFHVRQAAIPSPSGAEQLRDLAGHLVSQPLDMQRPPWELWFLEGLADGGFAMVAKVHHCMVDGVSGVGVLNALLSPLPDTEIAPGPRWKPRPQPGVLDFLSDGIAETANLSLSTIRTLGSGLLRPLESAGALLDTAAMGWSSLRAGLTPPAELPLNDEIGRQRRIDWRTLDLNEVRDVRKRMDGSMNDVVLAVVAGGLRTFLRRRRVKLSGLDVRIVVPVDTRSGDEGDDLGNKVSAWFLSLPVGERHPRRRFERIREQTLELKRTGAEGGVDAFLEFADWAGSTRLTFWGVKFANWIRPYNLIVTNVHGPQVQLYLLGSHMRELHAQVPLFRNQGLSVAAMSYLGKLNLGITADRDLVPDFMHFGDALEEAFAELKTEATSPRSRRS